VTTAAQRSARTALDAARPAVARLDSIRGPEDVAADLVDIWSAIESALRSLSGANSLAGQALIREARQRQLIDFDQANTLAGFQAARDRLQDTSYRPTDDDVAVARSAVLKLDAALVDTPAAQASRSPSGDAWAGGPRDPMMRQPAQVAPAGAPVEPAPKPSRKFSLPSWAILASAAAVLAILGVGAYFLFARKSDPLEEGIVAYQRGQREVAANAFSRAERQNPAAPRPHIYLARMARDVGNYGLATQELKLAIEADPNNSVALREMGANLLMQKNYEVARSFYVRAVQADPNDKIAMGYLGCTLMRLGRTTEAATFMNRAGPGPWNSCAPPTTAKQMGDPAGPAGLVKP
jgi:tetratricopeptide (TPR) repeat protein